MFNNIPFVLVKDSIKKRWPQIKNFTKLSEKEFIKGLEVLMNSLYFQFDNKFYRQTSGLPMGLSLSPILADLVIQDLEQKVLETYNSNILSYSRYDDDSFMILNKEKVFEVLKLFNSHHSNIKFTYEMEKNDELNFLDILVIKNNDLSLSTDIYKKPTFSGPYLNYYSNHSFCTKIEIIKNSLHKIVKFSNPKFHEKNFKIFKRDLIFNGYPTKFIDHYFKKNFLENLNINSDIDQNNNTNSNTNNYKDIIVLPLIPRISKKLQHTLRNKCNMKTVFRTPFKLNKIIKTGKDPLKRCNNKNLVYKINCKNCPITYVGQTKRLLKTRAGEHKKNIKLSPTYHNVISKHTLEHNGEHEFDYDYDNIQILHRENHFHKRSFAEMVYIQKNRKNSVNKKSDCDKLADPYKVIIDKI